MKPRTLLIVSALLLLASVVHAITLEQLAGTYVGKRTETFATEVRRYDVITVIDADGLVANYLYSDGTTYVQSGYITVAADGTITSGGGDEGFLDLNGKHLDITVQFFDVPPFGTVIVEQKLHRTEKPPKFP